MGKIWGSSEVRRIIFVFSVSICMISFQNMSPVTWSGDKPLPEQNNSFLPNQPHGDSPAALQNEIFDYNFGDSWREVQKKYGHWTLGESSNSNLSNTSSGGLLSGKPNYKYGVDLMGGDRLTFFFDQNDLKFRCDYLAGGQKMELSLRKPLTARSDILVKHSTENQQSSLNFSYRW